MRDMELYQKVDSISHKVDDLSHKVDTVGADVKTVITLSEELKEAIGSLQNYFFSSSNQRNVPTTYIILDSSAVLKSKSEGISSSSSNSDDDDNSKKSRISMMRDGLERVNDIMTSVSDFVDNPGAVAKKVLEDKLNDSLHMYLLCECCREPQEGGRWPVVLKQPKTQMPGILALAKVGLTIARGINCGLAIGKCFGLPLPSVDDANFTGAREQLNQMGVATLDDYKKLQTATANCWGTSSDGNGVKGSGTSNDDGFAIAEFERLLESEGIINNNTNTNTNTHTNIHTNTNTHTNTNINTNTHTNTHTNTNTHTSTHTNTNTNTNRW